MRAVLGIDVREPEGREDGGAETEGEGACKVTIQEFTAGMDASVAFAREIIAEYGPACTGGMYASCLLSAHAAMMESYSKNSQEPIESLLHAMAVHIGERRDPHGVKFRDLAADRPDRN